MNFISKISTVSAALAVAGMFLCAAPAARAADTLANMQSAFNGETNAHARYLAFAKQADADQYGEVASLFRAAARAEEVHARNHSEVIKKLGGVPTAKLEPVQLKSTRENLQAAIKGEAYERDQMYPEFLKQARIDGQTTAIRSLNLAKTAEAEHAKLYASALSRLDTLKGSKCVTYFVCPTCGFTTPNLNFANCPSCLNPKETFEKIS